MTELKAVEGWGEVEKCFLTARLNDYGVPTVRVNPDTLRVVISSLILKAKAEERARILAALPEIMKTDGGSVGVVSGWNLCLEKIQAAIEQPEV